MNGGPSPQRHRARRIGCGACLATPGPVLGRRRRLRREVPTVLQYAAYLTAALAFGPTHDALAVLGGMMGLPATEMAMLAAESFATVRGCATLMVISKGDEPPPGRCCKPRSGAGMDA